MIVHSWMVFSSESTSLLKAHHVRHTSPPSPSSNTYNKFTNVNLVLVQPHLYVFPSHTKHVFLLLPHSRFSIHILYPFRKYWISNMHVIIFKFISLFEIIYENYLQAWFYFSYWIKQWSIRMYDSKKSIFCKLFSILHRSYDSKKLRCWNQIVETAVCLAKSLIYPVFFPRNIDWPCHI